jgi:deazaflavin-dependent oxidoreductase (nitroreductase family)
MHFPRFLRRVNRVFTNPLLGTIAWLVPPMAIIHHAGRESGSRYRTPVFAFRSARGFVIPMTYGRDVDWGRNIIRAHGCELEWTGHRYLLRNPRIVDGARAYPHLPFGVRSLLTAVNLPGFMLLDLESKQSRRRK